MNMKIRKVHFVYFSPTGTTRRVVKMIKESFYIEVLEHDLTNFDYYEKNESLIFGEDDFVIFAFPVYSNRVPDVFRDRLEKLQGKSSIAAIIATYGKKSFGNSLVEMRDIACNAGFQIIGAMTVVAEHSVVCGVATGRPDEEDMKQVKKFGETMQQLISEPLDVIRDSKEPELPGRRPYGPYIDLPVTPYSTKACNGCGACVRTCPVGAITFDDKCHTDKQKCFGCMRCIRTCPQNARTLGKVFHKMAYLLLKNLTKENKQTQVYITCNRETT